MANLPVARIAVALLIAMFLGGPGVFVLAADSAPTGAALFKERRLALVIGNCDYPFAPLRSSLNDARDFGAVLRASGIDVTILENAKLRDTGNALRAFRSATQGLAQMEAPSGAVVAFATSPGAVASDGTSRNGLYTQHLIENLQRSGLTIEDVFKQVRVGVRRDSGGKQTPWESTSREGDFYFHSPDTSANDAANARQEQERLDAAVREAVARERERLRKELETIK